MNTLVDRIDFGTTGRRAFPLDPPSVRLDDVRVHLAVDPVQQNWVHLVLHGDDDSPYKTMLLVDGQQASYRDTGDPEPLDMGSRAPVPGGILITTALLPLPLTQGRRTVEIALRTYCHSYRTTAEATGTEIADQPSRRFLAVETHTAAVPHPLPEAPAGTGPDSAPVPSAADIRSCAERRTRALLEEQKAERRRILDAAAAGRLPSIERYREELRFLIETIDGPLAESDPSPRDVLNLVIATIDAHARDWSRDVTLIATGGHQSDWGGYHSSLGEVLYLAEPHLRDEATFGPDAFETLLDEPFALEQGHSPDALPIRELLGDDPTRRDVWELMLAANFDFARSRLSYIFNQVLYTYEGAWKAHEGLRVIGSSRYEGRERSHRIAREAWGIAPFLGEEVLVGPDGQGLDLFHSLFHHDRNAVLTDDVRRFVMTGRARTARDVAGNPIRRRPYGDHYRGTTERGLPRENSYVGVYGEVMNYLPGWVRRLSGRPEDAPLRDDLVRLALRNIEARSWMRYPDLDSDGRDVMRMEQAIDDRNPAMPGRIAYVTESATGTTPAWVRLALDVLSATGAFTGAEWVEERERAGSILAAAHQELSAGRLFDAFDLDSSHPAAQRPYLLRLTPSLQEALTALLDMRRTPGNTAGGLLPHSPAAKPARHLFTDVDALVASVRDGHQHLWVNLCSRSLGFSGTGRFHLVAGRVHVIGTLAVHGTFSTQRVHIRGESGEQLRQLGEDHVAEGAPFAWFGHLQPVTYQPGIGTTHRENVDEDTPYSAYPDLVWARCGDVLVAANTTRIEHGNARPLMLEFGHVSRLLQPREMVVLPVSSPSRAPDPVRAVVRTDTPSTTGLAWSPAGGARSYDVIDESTGEVLAAQVEGTRIVVDGPAHGRIRVDSRSGEERTRGSMSTPPRPALLRRAIPDGDGVLVGPASGDVTGRAAGTQRFSVRGGHLADGDDSRLDQRHRPDAVGFVPAVQEGSFDVTCTVLDAAGPLGLMVRSTLDAVSPAVIVLCQPGGEVIVQLRDTHTREDFGAGNPGEDARGGIVRSPRRIFWSSLTTAPSDVLPASSDHRPALLPGERSLRVHRDGGRGALFICARNRDEPWNTLLEERFPLPEVVLAGSCALGRGVTETRWIS